MWEKLFWVDKTTTMTKWRRKGQKNGRLFYPRTPHTLTNNHEFSQPVGGKHSHTIESEQRQRERTGDFRMIHNWQRNWVGTKVWLSPSSSVLNFATNTSLGPVSFGAEFKTAFVILCLHELAIGCQTCFHRLHVSNRVNEHSTAHWLCKMRPTVLRMVARCVPAVDWAAGKSSWLASLVSPVRKSLWWERSWNFSSRLRSKGLCERARILSGSRRGDCSRVATAAKLACEIRLCVQWFCARNRRSFVLAFALCKCVCLCVCVFQCIDTIGRSSRPWTSQAASRSLHVQCALLVLL